MFGYVESLNTSIKLISIIICVKFIICINSEFLLGIFNTFNQWNIKSIFIINNILIISSHYK